MEVHHHSHTARKKWAHYFWEFLMLFLAVFCGVLAEYQLEHKIEKNREKKYIESMVDDLRRDTANFKFVVASGQQTLFAIDTLISLKENCIVLLCITMPGEQLSLVTLLRFLTGPIRK